MDISKDITVEYVARIRHHEDILGIVLKGHLLIEHILDLIILKGMKQPRPILDDHRTFSFSVKSRIAFEAGLIDEASFDNVARINRIRNELAHQLSFKEEKVDFLFCKTEHGERQMLDLRAGMKKKKKPAKHYLYLLCFGTLSQLQVQYFKRYGNYPLFDRPIENSFIGK